MMTNSADPDQAAPEWSSLTSVCTVCLGSTVETFSVVGII